MNSVAPQNLPVPHGVNIVDPTSNRYALAINSDGSINVSGTISATNPSVGTNNTTAPTSSTEIGTIDGGGKLQGVSATNPLPVSGSFSASFTEPVLNVTGTASSAAVLSNFPVNPTTGYRTAAVQITVITSGNTIIAEESNDGTTWYGIQTVTDTVSQSATPMTAVGEYIFPISALEFRLRQSVFSSGSGSANVELRQNPPSAKVVALLGTPSVSAANFPTTVDTNSGAAGASTLRVITATNSPVQLSAGSAIAGKVGIDQTTPGTTNAVSATNLPTTVDTNSGAAGASTLRVITATNSPVQLAAGTNVAGKVGIDQTTPGTTNAVAATNFPTTVDTNTGAAGASTVRVAFANSSTVGIAAGSAVIGGVELVDSGGTNKASISAGGAVKVDGSAVTQPVSALSISATGSAVPADADYIGLIAKTANPTAASDGNLVGAMADKLGRQVVVLGNVRDNKANQRTALASSSETTVVTAVASTFLDVYGVIAANTTGSAVNLTFKDSTGGTTQFDLTVPANDMRGFMLPSSDGFKQTTVNNNWTVTGGASGVNIDILYVKNI